MATLVSILREPNQLGPPKQVSWCDPVVTQQKEVERVVEPMDEEIKWRQKLIHENNHWKRQVQRYQHLLQEEQHQIHQRDLNREAFWRKELEKKDASWHEMLDDVEKVTLQLEEDQRVKSRRIEELETSEQTHLQQIKDLTQQLQVMEMQHGETIQQLQQQLEVALHPVASRTRSKKRKASPS